MASSSHATGVETGAPGRGRSEYAEAMVRSRVFWLKSTKIRSPRSSFHQAVVTPSSRFSSSRPKAIAACRTSPNSHSRLDPHVDVDAPVARGLGDSRSCRGRRAARARPRRRAPRRRTSYPAAGRGRCAARRDGRRRRGGPARGGRSASPCGRTRRAPRSRSGRSPRAVRPEGKVISHRLEIVGSPLGHALLVERVGVLVHRPGGELHARPHPATSTAPARSAGCAARASARPAPRRSTPPPSPW